MEIIVTRQPWSRVRHWVSDLAQEVAAGLADGSLPPLAADRVWIGADDRARLLDWGPHDAGGAAATDPVSLAAQRFVYAVAAGALRGGFTLRALGAALVRADGRDASRLRALWRAAVAWLPLLIWLLVVRLGPSRESATLGSAALYTLVLVLLAAGAVVAAINPSRGIQDRLAGTWLVPR